MADTWPHADEMPIRGLRFFAGSMFSMRMLCQRWLKAKRRQGQGRRHCQKCIFIHLNNLRKTCALRRPKSGSERRQNSAARRLKSVALHGLTCKRVANPR